MKNAKIVLVPVVLFVLIIVIAFIAWYAHDIPIYEVKHLLESIGNWSYVVFFLLCIVRSFLLLPCGFTSALGGMLFGSVKGTAIAVIGYTLGSMILFYLSRALGKEWARGFLKKRASVLESMVTQNGFLSVLMLRLIPIFPFDAVSCLGGVSNVKVTDYVLATFIGSLPGVFLYVYFGEALKSFSFKQIIIPFSIIILMSLLTIGYKLIGKIRLNQKHS